MNKFLNNFHKFLPNKLNILYNVYLIYITDIPRKSNFAFICMYREYELTYS